MTIVRGQLLEELSNLDLMALYEQIDSEIAADHSSVRAVSIMLDELDLINEEFLERDK